MATIAGSTSANTLLFDRAVRHAIYLERFKGSEVKTLVAAYRELERDLLAQLAKRDPTAVKGRYTRARLLKLLDDVRDVISGFSKQLELDFTGRMRDLAEFESVLQVQILEGAVPVGIDWSLPAVSQVSAAVFAEPMQGRLLKEWFASLNAVTQDRVKASIRLGVLEGQGIREIGTRISSAVGMARRGAEMVARTAVNHVSVVARQQVFEENAEVMKGVRWVATLDGRTSAVCRARDGEVFPIDSGPRPPAHPNCRSSISPVLKSWRELGFNIDDAPEATRASMDGQVPASMTYSEWLKGQSAIVQDEVLGKTKAALFRQGELSLDKFVTEDGSELTLDALRARYPEAFSKARVREPAQGVVTQIAATGRSYGEEVDRWIAQTTGEERGQWLEQLAQLSAADREFARRGVEEAGLSLDGGMAVRMYTGIGWIEDENLYSVFNRSFRDGAPSEDWRRFAALLDRGLSQLPSPEDAGISDLFAGKPPIRALLEEVLAAFNADAPFSFRQAQSTSRTAERAAIFMEADLAEDIELTDADGIMFRFLRPRSAREVTSISVHSRENESIYSPDARFKVLSIHRQDGQIAVELVELKDDAR